MPQTISDAVKEEAEEDELGDKFWGEIELNSLIVNGNYASAYEYGYGIWIWIPYGCEPILINQPNLSKSYASVQILSAHIISIIIMLTLGCS